LTGFDHHAPAEAGAIVKGNICHSHAHPKLQVQPQIRHVTGHVTGRLLSMELVFLLMLMLMLVLDPCIPNWRLILMTDM